MGEITKAKLLKMFAVIAAFDVLTIINVIMALHNW